MSERVVGLHYGSVFAYWSFVEQVNKELLAKAIIVYAGLDEFTAAEKLAYDILKANGYLE